MMMARALIFIVIVLFGKQHQFVKKNISLWWRLKAFLCTLLDIFLVMSSFSQFETWQQMQPLCKYHVVGSLFQWGCPMQV